MADHTKTGDAAANLDDEFEAVRKLGRLLASVWQGAHDEFAQRGTPRFEAILQATLVTQAFYTSIVGQSVESNAKSDAAVKAWTEWSMKLAGINHGS